MAGGALRRNPGACDCMPASGVASAQHVLDGGGPAARSGRGCRTLLAARALGLAATPTTFAIADRAAAQEVLGLPEDILPFTLIPVGYPLGKFGPVTRRPVSEIMRWDRWS